MEQGQRLGKRPGTGRKALLAAENGMNIVGQGLRIILFTVPALVGAIAAHVYMPGLVRIPLPAGVLRPFGFVLIHLGAALWLTAIVHLLTGFPKGTLVTAGAYRVCRNPIYSSFAFFILPGISLAGGTWVYFFVSAVLYLGVMVFIENEEKDLLRVFGEEYRRYTARVQRLIPFASGRAL